jgi:hypothetical protein
VFSPGLATLLSSEELTSRDPLSRDPATRSSAVCERIRPGSVTVFPEPHDLSRLRRVDFAASGFPWEGTWSSAVPSAVSERFGLPVFRAPYGPFGCRRFFDPRSHVSRYLALSRRRNGVGPGRLVFSPVLSASSTAVDFTSPALA